MDPVAVFFLLVLSLVALWCVVYTSVLAAIRKSQQPITAHPIDSEHIGVS